MGAPKQKWTQEEEAALKAGVIKHGAGKWRTILKDPEFSGVLYLRSNVDLKDKWRNMSVMANGWGSREKARLALKRMQPAPKQDENPMAPSTSVESDEEIDDVKRLAVSSGSLQIGVPKRSIIRLDNLIMDALNNLKEPGGSNKTAIATYIEEQYWAPPNFKRSLSAKLKFLTASGKLIKMKRKYRIATPSTLSDKRRNLSGLLLEGRQRTSPKIDKDDNNILTKAQVDLELARMRSMNPQEAAVAAAQAVAEAEAAIAEAEEAAREAEAAEADAEAAQAFAEAALKTLKGRNINTPRMIYGSEVDLQISYDNSTARKHDNRSRRREEDKRDGDMDDQLNDNESLIAHIQQVEHERDELRKDIEQLCMQQAGPGYLAVATRMHFQRTAGLEQEIESLKKKLTACTREKLNLQEELSEAYRIKGQLADLHAAEAEKSKEKEELMSQKLNNLQKRVEELDTNFFEEKKLTAALQIDLEEQNKQNETFKKVINKFYEIRQYSINGFCEDRSWEDKCECLLHDSPEMWDFNDQGETSTSKYIVSSDNLQNGLEEQVEKLRKSVDNLQNKLSVGLEIENHLKKRVRDLEKKKSFSEEMIKRGISGLHHYHSEHKAYIMNLLDEGYSDLKSIIEVVEEKIRQLDASREQSWKSPLRDVMLDENDCRDLHVNTIADPNLFNKLQYQFGDAQLVCFLCPLTLVIILLYTI
ncbi:hypothetical protein TEA_002587 [Camellia sinensis var. sinensis]|uniref:MYB transcription factor n=1 Tax=Camellia sinensis var. sinensis TaxID=542762 RepID=A0A4S4EFJ0_CAMSN|nr:hypothetical protein TEA_002587 [Camellia sinensis var. sinensis]